MFPGVGVILVDKSLDGGCVILLGTFPGKCLEMKEKLQHHKRKFSRIYSLLFLPLAKEQQST